MKCLVTRLPNVQRKRAKAHLALFHWLPSNSLDCCLDIKYKPLQHSNCQFSSQNCITSDVYSLLLLIHFCTPFEINVFRAMDFFNTSVWGDAIASVVTVVKGPKKSPICPLDGAHGLIYFEFSSRWWLLSTVSLPYLTLPNAARCVALVKRECGFVSLTACEKRVC